MSRSIGIETISRGVLLTNYGSFWQHYALRLVIRSFGFRTFRCEQSYWRGMRLELLAPIVLIKKWISCRSKCSFCAIVRDLHELIGRYRFIYDYWCCIGRIFYQAHGKACAYVVGGDSVWCLSDEHCFLLDKSLEKRKISYAVSAAWDKMLDDEVWRENIKAVANTFNAIAVREKAGAQCIKNIAPWANPVVVLDPVLLLDRKAWLDIARRGTVFRRKTLLYYAVNIWDARSLNLGVMEKCARKLGCDLRIIGIQGAENYVPSEYRMSPSPRSFLAAVRDSFYFVTNSFHGLVFSLLFHKRFLFIQQGAHRYGDQNVRQKELLDLVSLRNHMIGAMPTWEACVKILEEEEDWERIDKVLMRERERCMVWLEKAIS